MNPYRLLKWVLLLALLFAGSTPGWAKVNVFSCEPEWAALAQELGQDNVTVYAATTALQDPHQIQAKPSLIARLRNADLLVCTGAELEIGWLPVLLLQSANGAVQPGAPGYFEASRYVRLLEVPTTVDRSQGDVHAAGNPHIQTAAPNYLPIARALAERLAAIDPAHEALYQANNQAFAQRWDAAQRRWEQEAAPLRGASVLVHHPAWTYLFAWLGINPVGALEPKPGVPPSTQHMNALLAQLRTRPAKMVIRTPYDDPRASAFIGERSKIPEIVLPGTVGGSARAKHLFSLFDDTIARLLQGLAGQSNTVTSQQ